MHDTLKHLMWPLIALGVLLLFNAAVNPEFFSVKLTDGRLAGSLIDVLDRATPVVLIALGMTLVIATAGVDLSVGAVMAMAGSLAAMLLTEMQLPLPLVIVLSLGLSLLAGVWNGVLVSVAGIQPIVATLILMVAGRGVAQLITDGQIIPIENNADFAFIGGGSLLGLPFTVILAFGMILLTAAVLRLTALGMFIESVGGNENASRHAGLNVRSVRIAAYGFTGLCAGLAGLIYTSDITAADANNAGLYLELDAILAVVLGGTSLMGGRFFLLGSVVGALIIQTLNTTILMTEINGASVPAEYNLIIKALVVFVVCLLQSDAIKQMIVRRRAIHA